MGTIDRYNGLVHHYNGLVYRYNGLVDRYNGLEENIFMSLMHFCIKVIEAVCSNKNRNKMMFQNKDVGFTLSNTGLLPNQIDQENRLLF